MRSTLPRVWNKCFYPNFISKLGTLFLTHSSVLTFDTLPSLLAALSELTGDSVQLCFKYCVFSKKKNLFIALVLLLFSITLPTWYYSAGSVEVADKAVRKKTGKAQNSFKDEMSPRETGGPVRVVGVLIMGKCQPQSRWANKIIRLRIERERKLKNAS